MSFEVWLALAVLAGAAFLLWRRWRVLSLNWPAEMLPSKLKRMAEYYLRHHGIECYALYTQIEEGKHKIDGPFEVRIPNEQFEKRLCVFKLVCRDTLYIQGERFFYDLRHQIKGSHDAWMTAIVLTTSAIKPWMLHHADDYGIAIIGLEEFRIFTRALKAARAGKPLHYAGESPILTEAFKAKPDRRAVARASDVLARSEEASGNWREAERHWRASLDADPVRWETHLAVSAVLIRQNRYGEAGKIIDNAWSTFPKVAEIAAASARLYEEQKQWGEALLRWDEVIRRYPSNWIGYRGKIGALNKAGRGGEADTFLEVSAANFPEDIRALFDHATLVERRHQWNAAEALWRAYIAVDDRSGWIHVRLSRCLREQGKMREADAVLRDAMQLLPDDRDLAAELLRHAGTPTHGEPG